MRKQKKNSKNVKRLRGCAALLLCGLLVCGMLAGCSKADVQKDTQNTGSPVEAEDILIQTSYGTLHYPGNWQEYVTIRQEQSGSVVLVTFETEIDGAKYELMSKVTPATQSSVPIIPTIVARGEFLKILMIIN